MRSTFNPQLQEARAHDWAIKAFYSIVRQYKEGGMPVIDISSNVESLESQRYQLDALIRSSCEECIDKGLFTTYPSSWGNLEFRNAVADFFKSRSKIKLNSSKNVMVTSGIIKAVDLSIQSLNIDYIVIPEMSPYFVKSLALLRGKKIISLPTDDSGNFNMSRLNQIIESLKIPKGKLMIYICRPSSPLGQIQDKTFIEKKLIPFAIKNQFPIFSDSYIFTTNFSSKSLDPIISYKGALEIAIEAITLSKEMSLPGIRIGAVVGNKNLINSMRIFASSSLEMIPLYSQIIAKNCLKQISPDLVNYEINDELQNHTYPLLAQMNWPHIKPEAGIDLLLEVPLCYQSLPDPSLFASLNLLCRYKIAFCPASVFGSPGKKYVRIVLKQSKKKVSTALRSMYLNGFNWAEHKFDSAQQRKLEKLVTSLDLTNI